MSETDATNNRPEDARGDAPQVPSRKEGETQDSQEGQAGIQEQPLETLDHFLDDMCQNCMMILDEVIACVWRDEPACKLYEVQL